MTAFLDLLMISNFLTRIMKTRKAAGETKSAKTKIKYHVQVHIDEDFAGDVSANLLRAAARAALAHEAAGSGTLTIAVSGDETLRDLNQKYLGLDYPTDVLSFPSEADDPDAEGRYFGDIAISFPRASAQAGARGHSPEAELQLLTVHGVLHLLGHDHDTEEAKARLWQAQAEILAALGCEITGPKE
jgi:probable rRNA maturation factor